MNFSLFLDRVGYRDSNGCIHGRTRWVPRMHRDGHEAYAGLDGEDGVMAAADDGNPRPDRGPILAAVVLASALLWASWPVLRALAERWSDDPRYAHGYLVPAFAGVLLWLRRDRRPAGATPSWWGVPV